ncbi:energy-coupling factor transport system substrate-specific component [Motilibacter rhizosphaerae]|uniref:Energy-coupling factor transport system substrate-specific component n=1 Tax=Motilibacter rhizosphaerae TaxID=598652 RepID=A0A4V2F4D6_9ACTN|nr:ECF transporter S component [Motilibacter rhizosphaerae]RZS87237.1 energy-coupling factor transport system substrate-specific component [Motilibacter rhizosphaerae]
MATTRTSTSAARRSASPSELALGGLLAVALAVVAYVATRHEVDGASRTAALVTAVLALAFVGAAVHGVLTRPVGRWRTVDMLVAAALAVACGVVFRGWSALWDAVSGAFGWFPPAQAVLYGAWFLAGSLVPLVVRRPGAALLAEFVASLVEYLLLDQFGALVLVYGVLQGLAAEAAFAAFGYRRWNLPTALLSGALGGVAAAVLDIAGYYADWSAGWKLAYVPIVAVSGAVLSGWVSWLLVRALAPTGALAAFPSGRERELV